MNRLRWMFFALAIGTVALSLHGQAIQVDKNNRTIAVTATDKASAEADIALISVGYTVYAPDAAAAYQQGSQLSNAILDALKKAGIPDKTIESQQQNLQYTQFSEGDKNTPEERQQRRFTLSQSWTVKAAAKDAANVLHVAVQAGANESGNIEWDLSDRNALQGQAAAKALVHAKDVATHMAEGLNTHLGPLVYASNQTPVQRFAMNMSSAETVAVSSGGPLPPAPLAIRPQQVEESATVYAVFAIE